MDISKFDNFKIGRYKFILTALEDINFPSDRGSTLGGGFGIALKNISCAHKRVNSCKECLIKDDCAYFCSFEKYLFEKPLNLYGLDEIPKPFVIEPPSDEKENCRAGDKLEFTLILFGRMIKFLPYFIFTFRVLGETGIGKFKGRYELAQVSTDIGRDEKIIYGSYDKIISNDHDVMNISDHISQDDKRIFNSFDFITPTRIKYENDLVVYPDFHHITRSLLSRLSALARYHCGFELDLDYSGIIEKSQKIIVKFRRIKWIRWERNSIKHGSKMKTEGFIGTSLYEGNTKEFAPLLKLGELVHIGKNCTFGLGKYRILA